MRKGCSCEALDSLERYVRDMRHVDILHFQDRNARLSIKENLHPTKTKEIEYIIFIYSMKIIENSIPKYKIQMLP